MVGVFVPEDRNAGDKLERRGQLAFDFGQFWFKGQSIGTGQGERKGVQPSAQPADRTRPSQAVVDRLA